MLFRSEHACPDLVRIVLYPAWFWKILCEFSLRDADDCEYMAKKVKNTNGCYVVPAFTGLGAPYWDQYARGTIVGLTRGVNKYHIIRATLESLAYQAYDVQTAMKADSDIDLASLKEMAAQAQITS